MAKDRVGSAAKAHGETLSDAALGCWESLSFYRWCHVETELIVLRREASPLTGSSVLKTCYSIR